MTDIASVFGLHELAVEDAVHAHQRPKLEAYADTLFVVLRTVGYVAHDSLSSTAEVVSTGEIMLFVGTDYVITVRHGDQTELATLRHRLEHPHPTGVGADGGPARRRRPRRRRVPGRHRATRHRHRRDRGERLWRVAGQHRPGVPPQTRGHRVPPGRDALAIP